MVIPDRILSCLASATFGELLELAGLLPDAIILRAEVATSSSFCDAKAVSLETPVSVCQLFASKFVRFVFKPFADASTGPPTATWSAFNMMMERAELVVLPDKVHARDGAELRGDQSLCNALLDVLASIDRLETGCSFAD